MDEDAFALHIATGLTLFAESCGNASTRVQQKVMSRLSDDTVRQLKAVLPCAAEDDEELFGTARSREEESGPHGTQKKLTRRGALALATPVDDMPAVEEEEEEDDAEPATDDDEERAAPDDEDEEEEDSDDDDEEMPRRTSRRRIPPIEEE